MLCVALQLGTQVSEGVCVHVIAIMQLSQPRHVLCVVLQLSVKVCVVLQSHQPKHVLCIVLQSVKVCCIAVMSLKVCVVLQTCSH